MTAEAESLIVVALLGGILAASALSVAGASSLHTMREARQTDPISGLSWKRTADPQHPAAPPRLVLVQKERRGEQSTITRDTAAREAKQPAKICVRAGDRVLLRGGAPETSALVLEGTALQSGAPGDHVRARITVTGALIEMTVLGAGTGILTGRAAGLR